jgi:hypothetical protein
MTRFSADRKALLRQLRQSAKPPPEPMGRRDYWLPDEMLDRIMAYAAERKLPSEVAAVRELLQIGLLAKAKGETP